MARAREIADALHECERDQWQCETCTGSARENSRWCLHCEMYWTDDAPAMAEWSAPQEAQDE